MAMKINENNIMKEKPIIKSKNRRNGDYRRGEMAAVWLKNERKVSAESGGRRNRRKLA
jgi:hypothetical protein